MRTKLFLIFSSDIFPKYECITSIIFRRNSNTIAALTFCLVTAANQILARCSLKQMPDISIKFLILLHQNIHFLYRTHTFIWKKLVRAIFVTGDRTCCRAWITLTRNASTAFRPISSRYTREMSTSPLWLYTKSPPIIVAALFSTLIVNGKTYSTLVFSVYQHVLFLYVKLLIDRFAQSHPFGTATIWGWTRI